MDPGTQAPADVELGFADSRDGFALGGLVRFVAVGPIHGRAAPALLDGSLDAGVYYRAATPFAVRAGDSYSVLVQPRRGTQPGQTIGLAAGPLDGGGLLVDGIPDPAHSLVFRTAIHAYPPTFGTLARLVLGATPAIGQTTIDWTSIPGATSYEIVDSAPSHTAKATLTTNRYVDTSLAPGEKGTWSVRAQRSDQTWVQSDPAIFGPSAWRVDAHDLGEPGASRAAAGPGTRLGQSFTVERDGDLVALELTLLDAAGLVELRDASDALLASGNVAASRVEIQSLDPAQVFGPLFVPSVPVPVRAGQHLSFVLQDQRSAMESSNLYSGGAMLRNGVEVPGRDLVFKVFVK